SPDPYGFGGADEDGLRMLAALETLTSLEPDYYDDLAAEASVTIIEAAGADVVAGAFSPDEPDDRPLRSLLRADPEPALLLNGYETFLAPGEEATVEIVQVDPLFDDRRPCTRAAQPASLSERIAAATGRGGRFFRALSGS
ncbi:MAG: hypothetical protein WC829_07135, partial [Hyphomicrobium sp.]